MRSGLGFSGEVRMDSRKCSLESKVQLYWLGSLHGECRMFGVQEREASVLAG